MNLKNLLGQVLLWAGFLSAAMAAVCQRETDFLPPQEQLALKTLTREFKLKESELTRITSKELRSLKDLSSEEFASFATALAEAAQKQKELEEAGKEAAKLNGSAKNESVSAVANEKPISCLRKNNWR